MKAMKPYVVSADIQLLLNQWAVQRELSLPSTEFMSRLRDEFSAFMQGIFPAFELVPEMELAEGMAALVSQSGLTPVSLDRVYLHAAINLDLIRLVDAKGRSCGLGHRPGTPPLLRQFKKLEEAGLREVMLVDDVIFTGELIEKIVQCLSRMGIRVPLVCAGIGIDEGIRRINPLKCEVRCVRRYDEVIDELCERDFYPGVPFSGRLLTGNRNIGVPYLLPFGNPVDWASIPPEWQNQFSGFCIKQTIRLFEEIERCSNKKISCEALGRMVVTLPRDETRFVDALQAL